MRISLLNLYIESFPVQLTVTQVTSPEEVTSEQETVSAGRKRVRFYDSEDDNSITDHEIIQKNKQDLLISFNDKISHLAMNDLEFEKSLQLILGEQYNTAPIQTLINKKLFEYIE